MRHRLPACLARAVAPVALAAVWFGATGDVAGAQLDPPTTEIDVVDDTDSTLPGIEVPDTTLPDTTLPDTTLPGIEVPDTTLPDTTLPDIEVPTWLVPTTIVDTVTSIVTDLDGLDAPTSTPDTGTGTDVDPELRPSSTTTAVPSDQPADSRGTRDEDVAPTGPAAEPDDPDEPGTQTVALPGAVRAAASRFRLPGAIVLLGSVLAALHQRLLPVDRRLQSTRVDPGERTFS